MLGVTAPGFDSTSTSSFTTTVSAATDSSSAMANDADEIARLRAALAVALSEQPQLQASLDAEKWAHAMTSRRLTYALEEVSTLRDELADRCGDLFGGGGLDGQAGAVHSPLGG